MSRSIHLDPGPTLCWVPDPTPAPEAKPGSHRKVPYESIASWNADDGFWGVVTDSGWSIDVATDQDPNPDPYSYLNPDPYHYAYPTPTPTPPLPLTQTLITISQTELES